VTVFLSVEDTIRRARDRLEAFCLGHNFGPLEGVERLHLIIKPRVPLKLNNPDHVERVLRALASIKPEFIVLDNLRRLAEGDENSSADMTPAMEGIEHIKDETGAAVLLLHHVGKSPGRSNSVYASRGSTAIPGFVDYQLGVERPDGGNVADVVCHDDRDGEGWRVSFQLSHQEDGGLRFTLLPSGRDVSEAAEQAVLQRVEETLGGLILSSPVGVRVSDLSKKLMVSKKTASRHLHTLQINGRARAVKGRAGTPDLWVPTPAGGGT
jgi:hypothetical protein